MKIQLKKLAGCVLLPLAVGGVAALLIRNSFEVFGALNKPPLAPPAWLFPVAWTILYILMGLASYLIVTSPVDNRNALTVYGIQLLFNFLWPILFFYLKMYLFAFIWLVLLWLLILACILTFRKISKTASLLLIPYIVWVTFAGYLNLGIVILN